jgi:hypothetical protein
MTDVYFSEVGTRTRDEGHERSTEPEASATDTLKYNDQ